MMLAVLFGQMRLHHSQVAILPMNMHRSYRVKEVADRLGDELRAQGIDVLSMTVKSVRVMFADMELIGIPHYRDW